MNFEENCSVRMGTSRLFYRDPSKGQGCWVSISLTMESGRS